MRPFCRDAVQRDGVDAVLAERALGPEDAPVGRERDLVEEGARGVGVALHFRVVGEGEEAKEGG